MTDPQQKSLPVFLDMSQANEGTEQTMEEQSGAIPFWGDSPRAWDTAYLGAYRVPGLSKLKGKPMRRHEKKSISGKHGATFTFSGEEPTEITITLRLWTAEQLKEYGALIKFLRSLKPTKEDVTVTPASKVTTPQMGGFSTTDGKDAQVAYQGTFEKKPATTKKVTRVHPVSITHPTTSMFGISQVLVLGFSFPEEKGGEGTGVYEATIECVEYIAEMFRDAGGVTAPQATKNHSIAELMTSGGMAIGKAPTSPATTNTAPGVTK